MSHTGGLRRCVARSVGDLETIMRLMTAAALALVCAAPAAAQDFTATPNYGEIHLAPGFSPDPALIVVQAGGSINAGTTLKNCSGYITSAPDIRLHWDGNGSLDLKVSAVSNADTTLVINGPSGEWYCDDDSGDDSNPSLILSSTSGQYDIWVGTYSDGDTKPAVVSISELSSF
jgi:hypothetical protein